MTHVNMQGFTNLRQEVKKAQVELPIGSLDWSIYQGQLDLLDRVQKELFDNYIVEDSDKTRVFVDGVLVGMQG